MGHYLGTRVFRASQVTPLCPKARIELMKGVTGEVSEAGARPPCPWLGG